MLFGPIFSPDIVYVCLSVKFHFISILITFLLYFVGIIYCSRKTLHMLAIFDNSVRCVILVISQPHMMGPSLTHPIGTNVPWPFNQFNVIYSMMTGSWFSMWILQCYWHMHYVIYGCAHPCIHVIWHANYSKGTVYIFNNETFFHMCFCDYCTVVPHLTNLIRSVSC
jgi:hypothetical protein